MKYNNKAKKADEIIKRKNTVVPGPKVSKTCFDQIYDMPQNSMATKALRCTFNVAFTFEIISGRKYVISILYAAMNQFAVYKWQQKSKNLFRIVLNWAFMVFFFEIILFLQKKYHA